MTITQFHTETPQAVKDVLNLFNTSFRSSRIRVFYGDTTTGKSWGDQNDVIGYVGNSTGTSKIPLLVHNSRSMGGPALLDHCIVAILDTEGRWRYKHSTFNIGTFEILDNTTDGRGYEVTFNGEVNARFDTEARAQRYVAFMKGERFSK